jgi:hypothetical protein
MVHFSQFAAGDGSRDGEQKEVEVGASYVK